eukprot:PhM_4_TR10389/c1_g1_i1/m.31038
MKTLGLTVHSCRRGAMGFLAELGYAMRFKLREPPDDIPKWENVADEGDAVDVDVTFFSSNVKQKLAVINATGRFVRFSPPRSPCRPPLAWITDNRLRLDALCRFLLGSLVVGHEARWDAAADISDET